MNSTSPTRSQLIGALCVFICFLSLTVGGLWMAYLKGERDDARVFVVTNSITKESFTGTHIAYWRDTVSIKTSQGTEVTLSKPFTAVQVK